MTENLLDIEVNTFPSINIIEIVTDDGTICVASELQMRKLISDLFTASYKLDWKEV